MNDAPPTLELREIVIALPNRVLVDRMNLVIAPGETVTVMGASGVGKSTLLAYISGTLGAPFHAGGAVLIGDRDITALPPEQRRIGILFQDDLLFPHLSVGGNLAFALPGEVQPRARRIEAVASALRDAGLEGFARRDPASLSGGQRARVALMRTLLSEPRALLLDEPFNKLDAALRKEFRGFVFDHATHRRLPTLLVTHDEEDARAAGGKVVVLG
ncbi:MAG TPA: ATP-binding cassette domain-containing protein [Casimicrobiaceae bacterium]|nr:ATP-binding cassette domain-containing protein [Casimicrobiaceae bacterium]